MLLCLQVRACLCMCVHVCVPAHVRAQCPLKSHLLALTLRVPALPLRAAGSLLPQLLASGSARQDPARTPHRPGSGGRWVWVWDRLSPALPCSQIYCIENAHGQLVRDLDFNPNKQYCLASCGDDCRVKFWDTRKVTEPVRTLEEHSHWCARRRLGEAQAMRLANCFTVKPAQFVLLRISQSAQFYFSKGTLIPYLNVYDL